MIVKAGNGCYLTESYDTPIENRRFEKQVIVSSAEELSMWREITETEKDKMTMQAKLFDVESVDYDYLNKVDVMLSGIAAKVNDANLTDAQAIEMKGFFPKWEDEIGNEHYAGFKFQYGETLYKVLQPHTFAAEWVPGTGTESLYKVVQEDHEGTKDDPIPWEHNMELVEGLYYTDKGVLYLCIRDSGIALSYDLAASFRADMSNRSRKKSRSSPNLTARWRTRYPTRPERRSLSRTSITRRTALPTCASKTQGCRYTSWARFRQSHRRCDGVS